MDRMLTLTKESLMMKAVATLLQAIRLVLVPIAVVLQFISSKGNKNLAKPRGGGRV